MRLRERPEGGYPERCDYIEGVYGRKKIFDLCNLKIPSDGHDTTCMYHRKKLEYICSIYFWRTYCGSDCWQIMIPFILGDPRRWGRANEATKPSDTLSLASSGSTEQTRRVVTSSSDSKEENRTRVGLRKQNEPYLMVMS